MFLKYFFTTVLSAFLVLSINSGLVYSNDNLNEEIAEDYFLKKPLITQSGISYLSLRKMTQGGHLLPNWVETNNFSIEWGNNISNFDGGTDSYRIVSCSKGPPCSGIPDMVDKWVDYFEEVWEKEIGDLGYIRPSGTDTYLYDIYIANTQDEIPLNNDDKTPTLSNSVLGSTITYCDSGSIYLSNCANKLSDLFSYIVVNGRITHPETMMVTAAHEFFHAIQFSYPNTDDWWTQENRWWVEATATWVEEVVYDEGNIYYPKVSNWLKEPELSLKNSGSHEYGDAIFIIFLTDFYLSDKNFVRYVLEREDSGINAIDGVLKDKYGTDFESAFKRFVAINAVADIGYTKGGYEEGPYYGSAAVTKYHSEYPFMLSEISGDKAPQQLGSNYILFIPPDNNDNNLVIEFNGADSINWASMVVMVRRDETGFDIEEINLDSSYGNGCHSIEGFGNLYKEVFLVPAVLADTDLTEPSSYNYNASLNSLCDNNRAYLITDTQSGSSNSLENSRCFIATAAFRSSKSPYVKILRKFRDKFLLPNRIGKGFVKFYYSSSPSIANFIDRHPSTQIPVRVILMPAIFIAFIFIKTTVIEKLLLLLLLVLLKIMLYRRFPRKAHQLTIPKN